MSRAQYFQNILGATFNVETPEELYQALDILHTQTIDMKNIDEVHAETIEVLEKAMDALMEVFPKKDLNVT